MAFTLRIVIGGLATFVQRGTRLFALMPTDQHHTACFSPTGVDNNADGADQSITGLSIDLTDLDGSSTKSRLPACVPASRMWGPKSHVDKKYYEDEKNWPSGLGTRIILPLPVLPAIPLRSVLASAEYTDGTKELLGFLAGQLEFVYTSQKVITIDVNGVKTPLSADAKILFEHRPVHPGSGTATKGTAMGHAIKHFDHMQGKNTPKTLLKIVTEEEYTVTLAPSKSMNSTMAVNPVECTVGSGCPDPAIDPSCGDG